MGICKYVLQISNFLVKSCPHVTHNFETLIMILNLLLLLRCVWHGGDCLSIFGLHIFLHSIENVVYNDSFDLGGCRDNECTLVVRIVERTVWVTRVWRNFKYLYDQVLQDLLDGLQTALNIRSHDLFHFFKRNPLLLLLHLWSLLKCVCLSKHLV